MKKCYFLFLLFLFGLKSFSQQQIITICSEKNGCEFAKVNLSKAQIDNILDKPNFLVKEKEVVILNLVSCQSSIEKNSTPQSLHHKFGGKGNIVENKNFDLRNYLVKNNCAKNCNPSTVPNAGSQANIKIGLTGNFTFNKKISFSITSSEGNIETFFYLNMQNGYAMMDNYGIKKMVNENYDGEMTQIMTSTSDFYQFTKSSAGNSSMKLGGKNENLLASTQKMSKDFFTNFKKTGAKKRWYGNVDSEEYHGIDQEGLRSSIWLSCPGAITVDKKVTYALTGFSGLGYVVNPQGETFLVTAIEGKDAKIRLLNIEDQNAIFSGKNYKPLGAMMAKAIGENQIKMNQNTTSENQYGKAMLDQMMNQNNKFSETSDVQDLASTALPKSEGFNSNQYNYIISGLEQSRKEIENQIAQLDKNQSDYKKQLSNLNCLKNCANSEKSRYEKVKSEHLALLSQYKNDDEKRDEKVSVLLQEFYTTVPCSCN